MKQPYETTEKRPHLVVTSMRDRLINDTADRVYKLEVRVRCLMFTVAVMAIYMLLMTMIGGWN